MHEDKYLLKKDYGEHQSGCVYDSAGGFITELYSNKLEKSIEFSNTEYFRALSDDKYLEYGGDEEG